jgi:hypothetical protein
MVEAFGKLPAQSAILDGELCLIDSRGLAHFYRLMAQMRISHRTKARLMFMAFDLLHQDGVDLRAFPSASATCVNCAASRVCRSCARANLTAIRSLQQVWFRGRRVQAPSHHSSGPSRNWSR